MPGAEGASRHLFVVNKLRPFRAVKLPHLDGTLFEVDPIRQACLEQVSKVQARCISVYPVRYLPCAGREVAAAVLVPNSVVFEAPVVCVFSSANSFPLSKTLGIDKIT